MANKSCKEQEAGAIRNLCNDNLDELTSIYNMLNPDSAPMDVGSMRVFAELDVPNVNGDDFALKLHEASENPAHGADVRHFSLVISAAYTFEAMYSLSHGNLINAWRCLTEARYYCGSYSVNPGLVGARQNTLDEGRRRIPSSGGAAKAARLYRETKKHVEELALSCRPKEGWPNWTELADDITSILYEEPGRKWIPGDRTIKAWLKKAPGADRLLSKEK